jgi:hypothetical protein
LKLQTSEKNAIAEQNFLKSWGIAIVEVLPSSRGIAIVDSKKLRLPTSASKQIN